MLFCSRLCSLLSCFCLCALALAAPGALGDEIEVSEIAPGIYMRQGVQEVTSAENRGHIANLSFIVGEARVAVIDAGGSLTEGKALLRAVRRVTQLPIGYLVLTHMHPDHVLEAAAFASEETEVVGHAHLADALMRRQKFYIGAAREELGAYAEGTVLVMPDSVVELGNARLLDLGGRTLELRAHPTAHTNNDLSIFDTATGTLWLSDLLFVERVPVVDGSLLGWLQVLDELVELKAERAVPGHGPVRADWKEAVATERRYLEALVTGVRKEIRENGTIRRAVETAGIEERAHWLLFDEYHGRNVTAAFVELEWE